MTEPAAPPPPPPQDPPPEPPAAAPPPPPAGGDGPNTVMLVLSYLGILALIPLLVEKDDKEVQWHAKHGLVLFGAELILMVVLSFLISVPAVGCLMVPVAMLFGLGFMALHVVCIAKALSGQRVIVPYVSEYADRF